MISLSPSSFIRKLKIVVPGPLERAADWSAGHQPNDRREVHSTVVLYFEPRSIDGIG